MERIAIIARNTLLGIITWSTVIGRMNSTNTWSALPEYNAWVPLQRRIYFRADPQKLARSISINSSRGFDSGQTFTAGLIGNRRVATAKLWWRVGDSFFSSVCALGLPACVFQYEINVSPDQGRKFYVIGNSQWKKSTRSKSYNILSIFTYTVSLLEKQNFSFDGKNYENLGQCSATR